MRRLALLLTAIVSTVAAAVGGLTWGSPALAAPARPDLVVDLVASPAEAPWLAGLCSSRSRCATPAPRPPTTWR
jgi:hypothetical protein